MTSFNDTATPLRLLATRRSGKARDLAAPGPDAAQLAELLTIAARVPDHGKLYPWRFVTVAGDRRAALADALEAAYRIDKPAPGRAELDAVRGFAFEAPCLVVVLSRPADSHIPRWEQELSAGAAAMLLCAAAAAMGFAANWLTGWAAYSDAAHAALAEPGERIAGFVFIGTPSKPLDERPRPDMAAVVRAF